MAASASNRSAPRNPNQSARSSAPPAANNNNNNNAAAAQDEIEEISNEQQQQQPEQAPLDLDSLLNEDSLLASLTGNDDEFLLSATELIDRPPQLTQLAAAQDDPQQQQEAQAQFQSNNATTVQLIQELPRIFTNEKHCPELLHYETRVMQSCIDILARQNDKLLQAQMRSADAQQQSQSSNDSTSAFNLFIFDMMQLECDRIQYLITEYHRIRLAKVSSRCVSSVIQSVKRQASSIIISSSN